jgi:hypothetical protein
VAPVLSMRSSDMGVVLPPPPLSMLMLVLMLLPGTSGERSGPEPRLAAGGGHRAAGGSPVRGCSPGLCFPHDFDHQSLRSLGTHLP